MKYFQKFLHSHFFTLHQTHIASGSNYFHHEFCEVRIFILPFCKLVNPLYKSMGKVAKSTNQKMLLYLVDIFFLIHYTELYIIQYLFVTVYFCFVFSVVFLMAFAEFPMRRCPNNLRVHNFINILTYHIFQYLFQFNKYLSQQIHNIHCPNKSRCS